MTMTKTVLCFGIILGLYCLVHGVNSHSGGDQAVKHHEAKHIRQRGRGYSDESVIPKDKIFIKSESPLRGRKIHQSAWSEEVTGPEEFRTPSDDSWNFEKLYSYLKSLIYKTEEMEKARMTPSETVAMIRNKIKSEIRVRKNGERLTDSETSYSVTRLENSYESSEEESDCEDEEDSTSEMYDSMKHKKSTKDKKESDYEECYDEEESEEMSSFSKHETRKINVETDDEKTSLTEERQISSSETKKDQLYGHEIVILNGTVANDERHKTHPKHLSKTKKESNTDSSSESKNTVRTITDKPVDSRIASPTASSHVQESTIIDTLSTSNDLQKTVDLFIPVQTNIQDKVNYNVATESNVQESLSEFNANSAVLQKEIINHSSATPQTGFASDSKRVAETLLLDDFEVIISAPEFIPINNKEMVKTEKSLSKVTEVKNDKTKTLVEGAHIYDKQSEAQKFGFNIDKTEIASLHNQEARETQSVKSIFDKQNEAQKVNGFNIDKTETSNLYNQEARETQSVKSIYDKQSEDQNVNEFNIDKTETSNLYNQEARETQSVKSIYDKQSQTQKVDGFNVGKTEVTSLQNQEAIITSLDTAAKTETASSMVFTDENHNNVENNYFQQESFFSNGRTDDILEEYNLKNEFQALSNSNKNEFMDILRDYKTKSQKSGDASQYSSMSQNAELNEENANQESFDTIIEYLYKHSKNPLILSLRNSNKTLF